MTPNTNPKSPFGHETTLVETYTTSSFVADYKAQLNLDVEHLFNGNDTFGLYECNGSGYRFFYPFNLSGDDLFYQKLQDFDWYYMPWKWEHDLALKYISKDDKILEVGSGGLGFISKLNDLGYDITGLELNQSKVEEAQKKNIKVLGETIQAHSEHQRETYDFVCSFQVLEHISDVASFIEAMITALKPKGKLLISVPNNDSFIKYSKGGILNFPPHHMGWWTQKPFEYLKDKYNLNIETVDFEPLQDYHVSWYITSKYDQWFKNRPLLKRIFFKLKLNRLYKRKVLSQQQKIRGHSIIVVFEKP
ncbi:class I SAM-dependent methyltransferase [Winogradskyella tangerina]|uniref:class I SAM-dependent methyltransferase n=1 Tax=Winogradskyella tangerina TaxID=2023240 RepID=UPI000DBE924E|nr:class I SAM-dependent methyltransferase [Winogradskyella tangerina]